MTVLSDKEIRDVGVSQYGSISPADIEFSDDIRKICEGNSCRSYGRSWACPPTVGTVEQCRERCLRYSCALVFCAVYDLEDSYDFGAMVKGHREFKKLCDRLHEQVRKEHTELLLLSNEGCVRCDECTYPDKPCRLPELLFPSLEGYGVNVMKLAKKANVKYNNGQNTVTYFGLLLY